MITGLAKLEVEGDAIPAQLLLVLTRHDVKVVRYWVSRSRDLIFSLGLIFIYTKLVFPMPMGCF